MFVAALALLAAGGAALTPPRPPTEVAPLTVYPPTLPPKVVASYPADGAAVAPGVLVLKLTFDQRMAGTGFDLAPVADAEAPHCLKTPRLLNDGKTFVVLCTLLPGKSYALALNAGPAGGFTNETERRAAPASLRFTTTTGEPVRSLDAAMKLESLTGLEVPVQEGPGS
ncbi:hypothetical protein [Phenylobacterium sp.]|uniref:hypothetical protein n=1 Tax=Phenylobacterium sp. TaxID=1871053 RepID=UPI0025EC792F|nr:hypothetical protein [Phenylobacterium sp.]